MILVTCAVGRELSFFTSVPHVEMLVTGVGPVEAAACVSRALALGPYELVINAGIAGAFEGKAALGEGVVVSEDFMEIDIENGDPLKLPDGARVVDRASSDFAIVEQLVERGFKNVRGITVSRVTASLQTAARLAAHDVDIESMEGFAVLRAAAMAGVPAVEIRGISNIVTLREASKWNFAAGVAGLESVFTTLLPLVTTPDA